MKINFKEFDFNSMKPKYCNICKTSYLGRDGEIMHNCHSIRDYKGMFNVYAMCEKCLSPLYKSELFITNRPYVAIHCWAEERDIMNKISDVPHVGRNPHTCELVNLVSNADIETYNKLINTRLIFKKDLSFKVEVIDDPKLRKELDEEFMNTYAKNYPRYKEFYDYYENRYDKIAKYKLEEEIRKIDEDYRKEGYDNDEDE